MGNFTFSSTPFCLDILEFYHNYAFDNAINPNDNNSQATNASLDYYYEDYGAGLDSLGESKERQITRWSWLDVILLLISTLGIVGNALNLIILTRQHLLFSMDRLERSSTYGLIALALSDLLFCAAALPSSLVIKNNASVTAAERERVFDLYYQIYGVAAINLFMVTSAWLVVAISINRLMVVEFPIRARSTLNGTKTLIVIITVCIMTFFITLPHFLYSTVSDCQTVEGRPMLEIFQNWSPKEGYVFSTYIRWVWPVLATFIPLAILGVCNIRLFWRMKKATRQRLQLSCRRQSVRQRSHRVSLTLIAIVIMFCILVCPAEILKYIDPYESWGDAGHIVAAAANVLQAMNFACNFVLYCVLNPYFRATVQTALLPCVMRRRPVLRSKGSQRQTCPTLIEHTSTAAFEQAEAEHMTLKPVNI